MPMTLSIFYLIFCKILNIISGASETLDHIFVPTIYKDINSIEMVETRKQSTNKEDSDENSYLEVTERKLKPIKIMRNLCPCYEYDETLCKVVKTRILCGYNKNVDNQKDDDNDTSVNKGCYVRENRIECGYVHEPINNISILKTTTSTSKLITTATATVTTTLVQDHRATTGSARTSTVRNDASSTKISHSNTKTKYFTRSEKTKNLFKRTNSTIPNVKKMFITIGLTDKSTKIKTKNEFTIVNITSINKTTSKMYIQQLLQQRGIVTKVDIKNVFKTTASVNKINKENVKYRSIKTAINGTQIENTEKVHTNLFHLFEQAAQTNQTTFKK